MRRALLGCALAALGCFHSESNGYEVLENPDLAVMDRNADVALTILDGLLAIYNQSLAGRETGSQGGQVACPNGGTVAIEGETSYDSWHGLTRISLVYRFSGCTVSQASPAALLTLGTGMIRHEGSFDSWGYVAERLSGTVDYGGTVRGEPVSATGCALSINRSTTTTFRGGYRSVSGQLCGASYAFVPGGANLPDAALYDASTD